MSWFHHLHGSCSSRVKTHLIAQTHISSMDVLHVSFRHDIFSYEWKGSATYGNAK